MINSITSENYSQVVTQTKPHYVVLDGLRGTAAICIVVFHFMEMVYTDYSKNFLGHGFLAVDFFFCLSGFVIAYAYNDRIQTMGCYEFFKARLIRLHPLVLLGSVLGLIALLFDPFAKDRVLAGYGTLAVTFLCSVILIPFPTIKERDFALFPLNSPSWTLFMEYLANIVYAMALSRLSKRWLTILTILSAIWLSAVAYRSGTLIGGWNGSTIGDGFARVTYGFLAGMLLYHYPLRWRTKLNFLGLSVLLIMTFIIPYFKYNWAIESAIVIFGYPFLIGLGANAIYSEWSKRICEFLGRLSYPLYMTHIVAIWSFGNYYKSHKVIPVELTLLISIGTLLLMGIGYLAMRFYDEPFRNYLIRRRNRSLAK